MLAAVLAMGLCHRPVDLGGFTAEQDQRVCAFLDALGAVALVGISPPPDPTPEDLDAVQRVNAQLAQVREHLRSLDGMEACR